nr:DUF3298 domain-containing protein [uncultured Dysosmobacter sp.]
MNEFQEPKSEYEHIPIPEELSERVQEGLRQGRRARARRRWTRSIGTVAACFAVLVGTLNLSPTVAAAAADVPVLGGLFQVLTVRNYTTEQDQAHYQVKVPEVDADGQAAQRVNAEIQKRVDAYIAEYQAMWKEYREAFLSTGGTEEEWAKRSMDVVVDYQIMSQTDTTLSFMLDLSQCSFSAAEERHYYNLNLAEDRDITLEELLGEDWVSRCNTSVQNYITSHTEPDGFSYFFSPEEGGFTTVDTSTSFYIREDGTVVLSFPRYSIAAGAAGIVEIPVE